MSHQESCDVFLTKEISYKTMKMVMTMVMTTREAFIEMMMADHHKDIMIRLDRIEKINIVAGIYTGVLTPDEVIHQVRNMNDPIKLQRIEEFMYALYGSNYSLLDTGKKLGIPYYTFSLSTARSELQLIAKCMLFPSNRLTLSQRDLILKHGEEIEIPAFCMNCKKDSYSREDIVRFKFMRCSQCNDIYYCDKFCQKEDWSKHQSYCKNFKCQ